MTSGNSRSRPQSAWVTAALSALLFGLTIPISKLLLSRLPSLTLAGLLYLGAAAVALPVVLVQPRTWPTRTDLQKATGAVMFGGAIAPALLLVGLQSIPASSASMLLNLELVFTALIAALVFQEHIGRRAGIGLGLLVLAGLVLSGSNGNAGLGTLLIAAACLCWGLDNNLTATADSISPAQLTLAKGVIAGAANLSLGIGLGGGLPGVEAVSIALAVGALGYGASIMLWVSSARQLGTARSQAVFAAAPFIGVTAGWAMTSEAIRIPEVVALGLMLGGVRLVVRSAHGHEHQHAETEHWHRHRHDDGHHAHPHLRPISGSHAHSHDHDVLLHTHQHFPDQWHRHKHEG